MLACYEWSAGVLGGVPFWESHLVVGPLEWGEPPPTGPRCALQVVKKKERKMVVPENF